MKIVFLVLSLALALAMKGPSREEMKATEGLEEREGMEATEGLNKREEMRATEGLDERAEMRATEGLDERKEIKATEGLDLFSPRTLHVYTMRNVSPLMSSQGATYKYNLLKIVLVCLQS